MPSEPNFDLDLVGEFTDEHLDVLAELLVDLAEVERELEQKA